MFDFPNSPTTGQQFTPTGGPTYTWNGYAWAVAGSPSAGYTPGAYINKFRNPGMDVAQRGASVSITTGTTGYTLDGWQVAATGATVVVSQQYNANLSDSALRIACATSLTACTLQQRIESNIAAQLLKNNKTAQPITVQFTIYNNSGASIQPQLAAGYASARDNFGTVTADLAATNLQSIANGAVATLCYTFTPNVNAVNGYQIQLLFGGALNAASGYVDISYADIRATPGIITGLNNNPPPVELRPIQQELAYCQRYYYDPANGGSTTAFAVAAYANTAQNQGPAGIFPVQMRGAPTMAFRNQAFAGVGTSWTLPVATSTMFYGQIGISGSGGYLVNFNITASAEL